MGFRIRVAGAALGLCLAAASSGATAGNSAGPDLGAIRAQQTELRAEAQAGKGTFKSMDSNTRSKLIDRQTQLLALIDGKETLSDINDPMQVRAFNLLEEIDSIINDFEGQKVVCEYVKKTGSHRKTKQCTTLAEKRRLQQETEDYMRQQNMRSMGRAIGE